jgi:lipoate-protein ligase A
MFRRRAQIREQLLSVIEKFRQKGALSPEKALTAEELGLPSEFKERMKRRLGQLGVFVEVNGKYYLSEERLKQVKDKLAERRRNRSW